MKILLEDIWYGGAHYDRVEIVRDDIRDDADEETITKVIADYFNKDKI